MKTLEPRVYSPKLIKRPVPDHMDVEHEISTITQMGDSDTSLRPWEQRPDEQADLGSFPSQNGDQEKITPPVAAQEQLIAEATQLAAQLVKLLNQLKSCNRDPVYSIASTFRAFLEADEKDLDFSFPSPPSQEIILEITREGRVKPPPIYLD